MECLLFAAAVFFSSLVSGVSGLGGGVLLFAFMAPVFPPAVLIPLHGCVQLQSNVFRAAWSWRNVDARIMVPFGAGAVIGALAGMPFSIAVSKEKFAVFLALFILVLTWLPKMKHGMRLPGGFAVLGAAASFLSLFVGAVGPLTAPFFLHAKLTKERFVATKAGCQVAVHGLKVGVYLYAGFALVRWLPFVLLAIPVVAVGTYLGKMLLGRVHEAYFNLGVKVLISVLAVRMLVNNLM